MFNLTYNKAISIDCPVKGCNAKAGEACNIKSDILMVKQFKNIHFTRQNDVQKLLYGNNEEDESKNKLIKRNGIYIHA